MTAFAQPVEKLASGRLCAAAKTKTAAKRRLNPQNQIAIPEIPETGRPVEAETVTITHTEHRIWLRQLKNQT